MVEILDDRMALAQDIAECVDPRLAIKALGGAHEAADAFDRAVALWSPPYVSPDGEILPEKQMLDGRVRDVLRNDGYARSGSALHQDSVVGALYQLTSRPNLRVLGLHDDPEWAKEFTQEVESKFSVWAESPDAWPDMARRMTFTEIVRMAVGVSIATGEFLGVLEWAKNGPRPYQTAFQVIDIDRLKTPYEHMGEDLVRGGVRLSRTGQPLGYYIWRRHPAEQFYAATAKRDWQYIRARTRWGRLRVLHLAHRTRPEQTRGVSELVAGLAEAKILHKFRNVTLQNAVVNASFAATIESELPTEAAFAALGGGNVDPASAAVAFASKYLKAVNQYVSGAQNIQIDGVKIPHLFPGSKLNMQPAGKIGGVGQDFEKSLLRHLAATLGVSYEELSRDYTATNYSSARAAMLQTRKAMASRKRFVADRTANAIYRAWFEEAANKRVSRGGLETLRYSKAPNIYRGMNLDAYTTATWLGAGPGQIDELKETQAALLRVKMGLSTYEDEIRKLGRDWRDIFAQRAREKGELERLDIVPGVDPSLNAASGSPRQMKDSDGGQKTPAPVKDATNG